MATIDVKDAANVTQTVERPLAPGRAAATASRPTVWANEDLATVGALTETAPATDTGSSGLNGRLQRVAQRLSSLISTGMPVTSLPAITGTVSVTGVPTTPATRGAGTADANTLRMTIDAAQVGSLVKGAVPTVSGGNDWFWFDVSQTNAAIQNTTGATGDYLESVLCIVATAATCQVSIKDGSGTARIIFPANVGGGIGSYPIPIGAISKLGAWQISTQAGVTAIATGKFS